MISLFVHRLRDMVSRYREYRRQAARIELRKGLYESSRAVDTVGGLPRASSVKIYSLGKSYQWLKIFCDTEKSPDFHEKLSFLETASEDS